MLSFLAVAGRCTVCTARFIRPESAHDREPSSRPDFGPACHPPQPSHAASGRPRHRRRLHAATRCLRSTQAPQTTPRRHTLLQVDPGTADDSAPTHRCRPQKLVRKGCLIHSTLPGLPRPSRDETRRTESSRLASAARKPAVSPALPPRPRALPPSLPPQQ